MAKMSRTPAPPPLPPGAKQRAANGHFAPGNHLGGGNKTKIFHSGEELYAAWLAYTAHVDANPYLLPKQAQFKGVPVDLNDKQMKAYSVIGFLKFYGVWFQRWADWRKDRSDLKEAMEQIEAEIYDHKHGGAVAGVLNALFVARDLKIAEKIEHGGNPDGPPVTFTLAPIQAGTFLPPVEAMEDPAIMSTAPVVPSRYAVPETLVAGERSKTAADDQGAERWNEEAGALACGHTDQG